MFNTIFIFNVINEDSIVSADVLISTNAYLSDAERHIVKDVNGYYWIAYEDDQIDILVCNSTDDGVSWNNLELSGDEGVAETTDYGQNNPTIAVDSDDYKYVVWYGSIEGYAFSQIRFTYNHNDFWRPVVNLTDDENNQSELPFIFIDSNDNIYIVYNGYNDSFGYYMIYYINSTDHGTSFSEPKLIYNDSRLETATISSDDTIMLVCYNSTGCCVFAYSTDYGDTWSEQEELIYDEDDSSDISIASNSSNIFYITWVGDSWDDYCMIRYCTIDGGISSNITNITDSLESGEYYYYTSVSIDSNDVVHVFANYKNLDYYSLRAFTSEDGFSEYVDLIDSYDIDFEPETLWASYNTENVVDDGFILVYIYDNNLYFYLRNEVVYVSNSQPEGWYDINHVATIHEGIDNVSDGGTVYIWDGTYTEEVIVDKPCSIIGNGTSNTIIDGDDQAFTIDSDDVTISDIYFNDLDDLAVYADGYNNCTVYDILATDSFVYFSDCDNCTIRDSSFTTITSGDAGDAVITLFDSSTSSISNNTLTGNPELPRTFGINIDRTEPMSYNIIENNIVSGFVTGININDDNNTIRNNTVTDCIYGINVSYDDNLIYNNYLANNTVNAYDEDSTYNNRWNATKTLGTNILSGIYLGGNYYDDYTGVDADHDGLGDTPYTITTGSGDVYDYLPLIEMPMLVVSVYNESNCSESLTFNILVSNKVGTQVYEQKDCVGSVSIPIALCPYGDDTIILISAEGYKQRAYYVDLNINETYTMKAYLPQETPLGREVPQITLRAVTDSKTVANPNADLTITLSNTLEELISVEIYNSSLYGTYGGWMYVSDDDYTLTSTQVTIDDGVLDENTTMARINYYYEYYYEGGLSSALYNLQVVETALESYYTQVDNPVEDAKVIIKRYENCEDQFVNMTILNTDANGYVNAYLMPYQFYKVFIYKDGYYEKISDYIPQPPNNYGQTDTKIFRIGKIPVNLTEPEKEYLFRNITWSITPKEHLFNTAFTITFTISSSDSQLQWYYMRVWYYNQSNSTWTIIYFSNQSNAGGGTISYTTPNITGRYMAECAFKKTGYLEYKLGQEGSFGWVIQHLQEWMQSIPDWAYMFVLTIIAAIVMGFFMMYLGTGLMTGYIGIGIYVMGFLLHPVEIVVDHPGALVSTVSGWAIVTILFIVYTIGLYLWSRL